MVEPCPFTVEAKVKLLVVVEIVKRLAVPVLIADCKSVEVDTPFTFEVKVVPARFRPFEVMMEEVATTPLMVVVKTLFVAD